MRTKHLFSILCLWLIFSALISCDSSKNSKPAAFSFQDDFGNQVALSKRPARFIALSAALTEHLFFVLPDSMIAGVTHTCNYPEAVNSKSRFKTWPFDLEGLLMLKPDLVITEEGMTPPDIIAKLRKLNVPLAEFKFRKAEDILRVDSLIAAISGVSNAEYKTNYKQLKDSLIAIRASQKSSPEKALIITWHDPIYAYGKNTLASDLMQLAGLENAIDSAFPKQYPELSREYILKTNPDIIFGGSFGKMDSTFFRLYPELKRINAYKSRRVYELTDDLITRPSPRILQAVDEIRHKIEKGGAQKATPLTQSTKL